MLKAIHRKILKLINHGSTTKKELRSIRRGVEETIFAACFQSTICDSKWLVNKTFSPGRWAVGFPFLYVMYRVLNEVRPKKILELGLGQSTRMTCQYADFFHEVRHRVVEHDEKWISFFTRQYVLPDNTEIVRLDWDFVSYADAKSVRVYEGFAETFASEKFDLIVIDGPLGGDMKEYSRIDVLRLMPDCLEKDFVILLDDCEREGEARTVDRMCKCLKDNHIEYQKGVYRGAKDMIVICSKNYAFLTSM